MRVRSAPSYPAWVRAATGLAVAACVGAGLAAADSATATISNARLAPFISLSSTDLSGGQTLVANKTSRNHVGSGHRKKGNWNLIAWVPAPGGPKRPGGGYS